MIERTTRDLRIAFFSKIVFSAIFIISLFIPTVFSGNSGPSKAEKRKLQSKPNFSFSREYFSDYEKYLSDNFGFRTSLIEQGSKYKLKYFKSSNRPERVSIGQSKFLFFNIGHVYNSYSNTNLLTHKEKQKFKNQFIKLLKHAKRNDYETVFAFWPNKHTIYPEKLSQSMSLAKMDTITLAEQLIVLHNELGQELINVQDILFALKKSDSTNGNLQPYWRLDTHWNDLGAYFGYKTLLEKTFPTIGIKPYPLDSFDVTFKKRSYGDLTENLGFQDRIIKSYRERYLSIRSPNKAIGTYIKEIDDLSDEFGELAVLMVNEKIRDGSILVVYGDSYSIPLRRHFFSQHFNKVYHLRGRVDRALMEKIEPDIVMICRVEKGLKRDYVK